MKDILVPLNLAIRIRQFSSVDIEIIIDRLYGVGAFHRLIMEFDREIAKSISIMRKGKAVQDAQEIADRRFRLAVEIQEAKRFRNTKRGKLFAQYLPFVHHLRTGSTMMSWPTIVRLLKQKHHFSVSVSFLCRVYDEWKHQLEGGC